MVATLDAWGKVYPQEGTFPQTQWGVPSIVARFDGVLSGDKKDFLSYEIESCPIGMGYGAIVSSDFKNTLTNFKEKVWPPFSLVVGPIPNTTQDEHLWLPEIPLPEATESGALLFIRNGMRRDDPRFKELFGLLTARSVTPLWYRHSKSYGIKLGWWREVSDEAMLPWHGSFTVKPVNGMQAHDVFTWGRGLKGKSTRTQITEALQRNQHMLLQPFIAPMKMDIGGTPYNVMLRPYFGFHPGHETWEPIGGMWVARPYPNLRLHWASDAISGPLHIEAAG